MITVTANARNAVYTSDDLITSGSIGIPVRFVLSADFDGLSNIAVFQGSGVSIDVALTASRECVVPHEVVAIAGGYLRIGVYGRNGDGTIAIPTVWAEAKRILQGTVPSDVDPAAPTPDWTAQVQEQAAEALEIAQDVQAKADAGEFDGAPGEPGAVFTPAVSAAGVISWTNDGELPNPEPVNIKGTPGTPGISPTVTVTDITGGHRITITDATGPHSFDVMDGDSGDAPVQSVNGQTGAVVLDAQDVGAYEKPVSGIPKNDLESAVQTSLEKADTALQSAPVTSVNTKTGAVVLTPSDIGAGTYSKPSGGIPASDLAAGVIPTVPVQDVQVNGVSVLSGGVANVPVATQNSIGVSAVANDLGIGITGTTSKLYINKAGSIYVKGSTDQYRPIVPYNQHESTFYGLAKAAGDTTQSFSSNTVGNYTDAAKSAISQMLNGSVAVTGTTPTITALPGIRYVCGEVATLDITLPASGIVDVVFESGSTATVLTVTPPTGQTVKWANGFDPTALETNTTYEINIADGLGVAASWT